MDRDDDEALLSDHPHRCLQVFGCHKGGSIGAVDYEEYLPIVGTGLQVHHLASTEMQQLLRGHLAKLGGSLDSGGAYHLAGWQIIGGEVVEELCVHDVTAWRIVQSERAVLAVASQHSSSASRSEEECLERFRVVLDCAVDAVSPAIVEIWRRTSSLTLFPTGRSHALTATPAPPARGRG